MTRARWTLAATVLVVGCGSKRPPGESGRVAAAGLLAGVEATAAERAPWRCARGAGGDTLALPDVHAIGVIADARGPAAPTLDALRALRASFVDAGVGVVFTAGGMGTSQAELEQTLGALGDPAWTVVALPGAAESVVGLRGAIAALRAKGAAIVDGSTVRQVATGGADVVTLPGEAFADRLAAGADGCVRDRADIDAILARLGTTAIRSKPVPRVLISATAPRGAGDSSDRAPGGVHAGELDLAAALAQHPADLIVHPQVAPTTAATGLTAGANTAIGAGIADASPRYDDAGARLAPSAVVIRFDRSGIRWQRVAPPPR